MRLILALIALGLFGYFGYGVLTGTYEGGSSGKARIITQAIDWSVARFGVETTGYGLLGAGILLALFLLFFGPRDHHPDD